MSRLDSHKTASRFLRFGGITCAAAASIATFASDPGWELHDQTEDAMPVQLSSSVTTWSDDFRGSGGGSGAKRLRLDGAIEITPSTTLTTPVRVRIRFVPMGGSATMVEDTVFITGTEVFAAVDHEVLCQPEATCIDEGTLTVDVLDPSALGSATLSVHWVSTASLFGRGPSTPADAHLAITQP